MNQLDFHISYNCFNKCIFCSSSVSIKKFRSHPISVECILKLLREKNKQGFTSVNFTGGEPTLVTGFIRLLKETKKIGYRIYVGTNGGNFADGKFCRETVGFLDEVCFSCHGHIPRLHNFLTFNKQSFTRLEKAMDNLSKFTVRFSSNTVVNKYNFDYLDKILEFLMKKQIKQALISNLAPEGRGLENYDKLAVRLMDFKKKIPALVKSADKENFIIRFFGLPACILGRFACCSNDFSWDERLTIEQERKKIFFLKQEPCLLPTRGRVKTVKCRSCLYGKICGGIFEEYFKKYGDGELAPIDK